MTPGTVRTLNKETKEKFQKFLAEMLLNPNFRNLFQFSVLIF